MESTIGITSFVITSSNALVSPDQKAACWLVVTQDGRLGYTTNTATGTVTGFSIAGSGVLTLLDADGVTGTTGGTPSDVALSSGDQYMYVLNNGLHTVDAFALQSDGSLVKLASTPGIPAGSAGVMAK